jgi:hypothetical protein
MSASPATRTRARLRLAATAALAVLLLAACRNGEGLRDEGPSSVSSPTAQPSPSERAAP